MIRITPEGSGSEPRWIATRQRQPLRLLPLVLCVVVGAVGYPLRPGSASLELGGAGVLVAITWLLTTREPLLLLAIVLLGIDVALTTSGHPAASRDAMVLIAGSILYLVHASATLSVLLKGDVSVDVSVLRNWTKRTIPITLTSVAGLLAAAAGHVAGDERSTLAVGAIVVGVGSLYLVWLSRRPPSTSATRVQASRAGSTK